MSSIHQDDRAREEHLLDLDEIARQGARRMLAQALEAEVDAYTSRQPEISAMSKAGLWLCATATPGSARSYWEPGPWRSRLRGSMTVG
jgi:hypothetical protein